MFVRVKRSGSGARKHEYLQIVESFREGKKVRQRVVATLGRRDKLLAQGAVDGLLQSLARFSTRFRVVEASRNGDLRARTSRTWGPALVFGRLWERQGVAAILREFAAERRFRFDAERVAFAMALQRLCAPGSDLQGSGWVRTVEAPGFAELELQHFYRTCGFLHEVRERLERRLFFRQRDLFSTMLDLVFIDTTSTYVYGQTETDYRRRGYSRDRRGDLLQYVLCVAVDRHGWPIAWEAFPGNTADRKALVSVIETLRTRFDVRRAIVVADRGMIGRDTIELLTGDENAPFDYILGCRMRRQKEVSEEVLSRAGRYQSIAPNLDVKEVWVEDRRYVVCRNQEEAAKDTAARQAIIDRLEAILAKQGPKAMIKNRGYARFLKLARGAVEIDRKKINADARLDGKFVLRTNTDLPAGEVALSYKGLWRVERTFREQKSTLEVRPIYHQGDRNTLGHITASFLALRLEVDLQRRLEEQEVDVSWPDLMRDLSQLQAVEVEHDGKRYRLRTDFLGAAHSAFKAAGVRPPSVVTELGAEGAGAAE